MEKTPIKNRDARLRHTPTPSMSLRKRNLFTSATETITESAAAAATTTTTTTMTTTTTTTTTTRSSLTGNQSVIRTKSKLTSQPKIKEESDLGPMTLLKYSSSSSSSISTDENLSDDYNSVATSKLNNNDTNLRKKSSSSSSSGLQTDFKNLLQLSPKLNSRKKSRKLMNKKSSTNNNSSSSNSSGSLSDDDIMQAIDDIQSPVDDQQQKQTAVDKNKETVIDTQPQQQQQTVGHQPQSQSLHPPHRSAMLRQAHMLDNDKTPDDCNESQCSSIGGNDSKAKTSLVFSPINPDALLNLPKISVGTFYGQSSSSSTYRIKNRYESMSTNINTDSKRRSNNDKKQRKKQQQRKRKLMYGSINNGVYHSIRKPKIRKKKSVQLKRDLLNKKLNTFINQRFNIDTEKAEQQDNTKITRAQIERLKTILSNRQNPIDMVRPVQIGKLTSGSTIENRLKKIVDSSNMSTIKENAGDNTNDDHPSDDDDDNETIGKRKFFKSKRSSANVRGEYHLFGSHTVSVKRGSNLCLQSPLRKKKTKNNEYDEFESIRMEVGDIIKILETESHSKGNNSGDDGNIAKDIHQHQILPILPMAQSESIIPQSELDLECQKENIVKLKEMDILQETLESDSVQPPMEYHHFDPMPITSDNPQIDIESFRKMLPYNTEDPIVIERQQNTLDFLIANELCTEKNFHMFIREPNQYQNEIKLILNEICGTTDDDYNNVADDDTTNTFDNIILMENQLYTAAITPQKQIGNTPLKFKNDNQQQQQENVMLSNDRIQHQQSSPSTSALSSSVLWSPLKLNNETESILRNSNILNKSPVIGIQEPLKYYPIFDSNTGSRRSAGGDLRKNIERKALFNENDNNQNTSVSSSSSTTALQQKNILLDDLRKSSSSSKQNNTSASTKWVPNGLDQLQIDAGQKEFGSKTCTKCGMTYTCHEPEEELIHERFHNSFQNYKFKGWIFENCVKRISNWGVDGRILCVTEKSPKAHRTRTKEIIVMIDNELGILTNGFLSPGSNIYLGIAKSQIIGVCVVHPLQLANRVNKINGIDFFSAEKYTVKCGISRIWVSPLYRRHGIATHLFDVIRSHFIFGHYLGLDEIAFSSPTDNGKRLAEKLCNRPDFLTYDSINF